MQANIPGKTETSKKDIPSSKNASYNLKVGLKYQVTRKKQM